MRVLFDVCTSIIINKIKLIILHAAFIFVLKLIENLQNG